MILVLLTGGLAADEWRGVGAQVGQVSTPTANVLQGLQKTTEPNRVDDVVMLLFEEMQTAKNNGHTMPLSVVFVERKARLLCPPTDPY